jgi:Protein of unknown function (DUF2563)
VFVDAELLRSGGRESHRAGMHAQQAADQLSSGSLLPQMFGDFAAAEAFHDATGSVQARHVHALLGNAATLAGVGSHADLAAGAFTDRDESNATAVRAVRCDSAT